MLLTWHVRIEIAQVHFKHPGQKPPHLDPVQGGAKKLGELEAKDLHRARATG
jgi:hypothetical protein